MGADQTLELTGGVVAADSTGAVCLERVRIGGEEGKGMLRHHQFSLFTLPCQKTYCVLICSSHSHSACPKIFFACLDALVGFEAGNTHRCSAVDHILFHLVGCRYTGRGWWISG